MPESPKILAVDDNPATLYATARILRAAGFETVEAKTGQEALELARQNVDLIILDVNLPDVSGFEVCRMLREQEQTRRVPVIYLSATFVTDLDKVHGLEVGADGYLTRPVEPPVLVATVKAFLRTRRAEDEMRRSEMKFRAVFDNALDGIAIIRADLTFVEVNPALCHFLGRSREKIVGKKIAEFVPAEFRDEVGAIVKEFEARGIWRGRLPLMHSDERLVYLEWSVSAHLDPGALLAVATDITERVLIEQHRDSLLRSEKQAREEAERANALKDDFLATLSHELRTPLNAIVGWAHLLKRSVGSDGDVAEGIDIIHRNALAQTQLISDLLDVSRITSGKLRLDVQWLDPATMIESALMAISPAAEAKGVIMRSQLDRTAGPVYGDASRLQQVVWNLVTNAVKFTPKGGQVNVQLGRVESAVEVRVADNGMGIAPNLLPVLFERFRQGDASTTRQQGGLGLGLAIVKHLVEMHGGTVSAQSQGKDCGSLFVVRLPIAPLRPRRGDDTCPVEGSAPPEAPDAPTPDLQGIRVLVVEDEADARRLLSRVLGALNAEVAVAADAAKALLQLESFRPHVLLSDIGLPERDGYDLIREIRRMGYSFQDLPAIALTAFARTDDRDRALIAGYQAHIAKPVDPEKLATAIYQLAHGNTGGRQ
jgi:PAS domain S-box-containing protein